MKGLKVRTGKVKKESTEIQRYKYKRWREREMEEVQVWLFNTVRAGCSDCETA